MGLISIQLKVHRKNTKLPLSRPVAVNKRKSPWYYETHKEPNSYVQVQSPSWEANRFSAIQEILRFFFFLEPEISLPH